MVLPWEKSLLEILFNHNYRLGVCFAEIEAVCCIIVILD